MKIALVMGDGGIKGGFVAGAVDTVLNGISGLHESIDLVYGVSASAGNAMYYLNFGLTHPGHEMWTQTLSDTNFMNYRKYSDIYAHSAIYNIDYMVDEIFARRYPLDKNIRELGKDVVVPLLELGSWTTTYASTNLAFGTLLIDDSNKYQVIKAASAAPFVYDRPTNISGRLFVDAAAVAAIPPAGLLKDFDFVLYILAREKPSLLTVIKYLFSTTFFVLTVWPFRKHRYPILHYLQYAIKPIILRKNYDRILKDVALRRAGIICPRGSIGGNMDNTPQTLRKNYDQGVADALAWINENPWLKAEVQKR